MVRFTLSIAGDVQVDREIMRVGRHAGDARPVFWRIAEDLVEIEREQFDTEGGRSGGWAPLAAATIKAKAARGLDPRILHATLALRNSLTQLRGPGQKLIITDSFMVFGSEIEYIDYHQRGTSRMPQRRPVELTYQDRRAIVRRIQRFVRSGDVL